jgi:hypothetical protein
MPRAPNGVLDLEGFRGSTNADDVAPRALRVSAPPTPLLVAPPDADVVQLDVLMSTVELQDDSLPRRVPRLGVVVFPGCLEHRAWGTRPPRPGKIREGHGGSEGWDQRDPFHAWILQRPGRRGRVPTFPAESYGPAGAQNSSVEVEQVRWMLWRAKASQANFRSSGCRGRLGRSRPTPPRRRTARVRGPGGQRLAGNGSPTKRPTDPAVGLFIRQKAAKYGKTRIPPDTPKVAETPCKSIELSSRTARLKIVVSPVRVRVSPFFRPAIPHGDWIF